jgi:hypothetical protein
MAQLTPTEVFDSFARNVSGSLGTSDSGDDWLGDDDSNISTYFAGNSGYARFTVNSTSGDHLVYVDKVNQGTAEVLCKVRWNTSAYTDHGPVLRYQDANNYYLVSLQESFDEIKIHSVIGGVRTQLGETAKSIFPNTWYWVRFKSDGAFLRLRMWEEGDAEPGSWNLTVNYAVGGPSTGDGGYIVHSTSTTHRVDMETFYYRTLEDTEPALPVTDTFARDVNQGFGMSDTGHLWSGFVADAPDYYGVTRYGSVSTIYDGSAPIIIPSGADSVQALIGPSAQDTEVRALVGCSTTSGNPTMRIALRGSDASVGGVFAPTWYYAFLQWGTNVLRIYDYAAVQIGSTYTFGTALVINDPYYIKFRAEGASGSMVLSAKAWKLGDAEPGSWQVTGAGTSPYRNSGSAGFRASAGSVETYFTFFEFTYDYITNNNRVAPDVIYTNATTDTTTEIWTDFTNDLNDNSTVTFQYKKSSEESWTTAGSVTTSYAGNYHYVTVTGLDPGTEYDMRVTYADVDGVTGTNPLEGTFTTHMRGIDTSGSELTVTPVDIDQLDVIATYAEDSDDDSTATVRYRVGVGAWSSPAAMTADRPNKRFTASITGLTEDTSYEVEVTYSDADGFIDGDATILGAATTLGPAIELLAVAATPNDISAVIVASYDFDTNENASCSFQYRSIRQNLWTAINSAAVSVDRVAKTFRTTLVGLSPNTTYSIRATVSDPDGVATGSEATQQAVFTTTGSIVDPDKRSKHYLYKIYDYEDSYLGTWNDAPEPSFRLQMNGGTSDLTVVLPRRIAQVHSDPTIDFGNRVDIVAIDGQSDGMGRNLMLDSDMDLGSWTLATDWSVGDTAGPDNSSALVFSSAASTTRQVLSETIELSTVSPLVTTAVAKARGGKLRMDMAAYDAEDALLDTSDDNAETIGPDWQTLRLEWVPPKGTSYVRVRVENVGAGNMYFDKVKVLSKEVLIYRGRIESYNPRLQKEGESIEIEVFGLASRLTDTSIPFLQYATTQPSKDLTAGRPKYSAADPANMLKKLIDLAQEQNPQFDLYYTDDSIKLTGTIAEYTFRDQELRDAFDKVRNLCPPGWHIFVEPDGKVLLRGPEHVPTHKLRLHVEVMEFENPKSIKSMKNFITVRGRQDEDESEPDGFGSINYTAFDQSSIDRYGLRMHVIRDGDLKDPATAEIVGDGRLEELNRPEQRGSAYIPDEKDLRYTANALRGYNIEAFQPGDMVRVYDPISGEGRTYWDQFEWDTDRWDSAESKVLPEDVPINTVRYEGTHVIIELSQRQPNAIGDFAKLLGYMRQQEKNITD